jgi:hypothetical protein
MTYNKLLQIAYWLANDIGLDFTFCEAVYGESTNKQINKLSKNQYVALCYCLVCIIYARGIHLVFGWLHHNNG